MTVIGALMPSKQGEWTYHHLLYIYDSDLEKV